MQEHRAEADGGAVHQHEFARRGDATDTAQLGMHLLRHLAAIHAVVDFLDRAHAVLHQRRIDEARPEIQHLDLVLRQIVEAPVRIGMHGQFVIAIAQRLVEVDDSGDEIRPEHPHAAEIQQIHAAIRPHRIIAEMRIAMDRAEEIERHIPGAEHVQRHIVAEIEIVPGDREQRRAVEPVHGQEPLRAEFRHGDRHMHAGFAGQHIGIERHVPGLQLVIQLLAQPGRQLFIHARGRDRLVVAFINRHGELQLLQIGLNRRLHVGILQLAGKLRAVLPGGAMHLPQRGGGRGLLSEFGETGTPVRPQLGGHAALHEQPAHRRGVGLQLLQLLGIFLGQRVGDGGENLRHLHQRPLQPAQRLLQPLGMLGAVQLQAEIALARQPCRQRADLAADLDIAPRPAAEPVVFVFGHGRL